MSTHNIGFYEDLTKIILELSSKTHLISSADMGRYHFIIYYGIRTCDGCELDTEKMIKFMSTYMYIMKTNFFSFSCKSSSQKHNYSIHFYKATPFDDSK